jgi:hypothetical protein
MDHATNDKWELVGGTGKLSGTKGQGSCKGTPSEVQREGELRGRVHEPQKTSREVHLVDGLQGRLFARLALQQRETRQVKRQAGLDVDPCCTVFWR